MAESETRTPVEELKSLYDTYINNVMEQWTSQDLGGIIGHMFTGGGRFGRDTWIEPFLRALEELTTACGNEPVEAAEMLDYMLFGVYGSAPEAVSDGLAAAEGKALPLVGALSETELAPLYERYRARLRRSPGLPCQRAVLKAMKSALKE